MDCDNVGDSDDGVEFEGHPIPQLVEVSDNQGEESEDDQWDDGATEDLLDVLETNVELDASGAGVYVASSCALPYSLTADRRSDCESLGTGVSDELKLFGLKLGEPTTERTPDQISCVSSYECHSECKGTN